MSLTSKITSLSNVLFIGDFAAAHILLPLATKSSSVIVTALQRHQFAQSLVNHADAFGVASPILASKTRIYYPASASAAKQLITLLAQHELTTPSSFDPTLTLPQLPSLVILHQPSAFLHGETHPTMSSYLDLITTFIAAISSLEHRNLGPVSLAVFDSDLAQLELPILKPPAPTYLFHPDHEDDPQASANIRKYSVYTIARKYFEWIGQFHLPDAEGEEHESLSIRRHLELHHTVHKSEEAVEWYDWPEAVLNPDNQ